MKNKSFKPVLITAVVVGILSALSVLAQFNILGRIPSDIEIIGIWKLYLRIIFAGGIFLLAAITVWSWLNWSAVTSSRLAAAFALAWITSIVTQLIIIGMGSPIQVVVGGVMIGWAIYLISVVAPNMSLNGDSTSSPTLP